MRMLAVVGVVLATLSLPAVTAAPQPAQGDTLAALLVEVRGLRAAMEQMAVAGPRVQLAMGRLQIQEQRISNMVRRLDAARGTITSLEGQIGEMRDRLAQFQNMAKEGGADPDAPDFKQEMAGVQREIARMSAELERQRAEEAQLLGEIGSEQNRWSTINQQLDELERAMTRK